MPRDYKSRADARSRKKGNSPGWVWFVSGVLVGLFSAGLIWLKFTVPAAQTGGGPAAASDSATAPRRVPRGTTTEKGGPPPPRFDFYTLLPEMEVVIPEEELQGPASSNQSAASMPPRQTPDRVEGEVYLLQMGSFRNHADADRMKARLALLDIPAEIQKVTINNKDTFHRVRSGPYESQGRLKELRNRLRQNSIKSMVIRLEQ